MIWEFNFLLFYLILLVIISIFTYFSISLYYRYTNFSAKRSDKEKEKVRKWIVEMKRLNYDSEMFYRNVTSPKKMIVFLEIAKELLSSNSQKDNDLIKDFIDKSYKDWLRVGQYYLKESSTHKAYYAYATSKLPFKQEGRDTTELESILLKIPLQSSIYSKNHAFAALTSLGNPHSVVEGLEQLSQEELTSLNTKLITDSLLAFTGDFDELLHLLYTNWSQLSSHYQTAVIDFARIKGSTQFQQLLLPYLDGETEDVDYICAVLRYYGKIDTEEAYPYILSWANNDDVDYIACTSVATSTLIAYHGQETIEQLIRNVTSRDWYVRRNAAEALSKLVDQPQSLSSVFEGEDQYAIDQLAYYYEKRGLSYEY